ncbi:MAG: hypothetical protein Kow0089_14780 [Desulfobulbaceae bacterium]
MDSTRESEQNKAKSGFSGRQVVGIVLFAVLLTVFATLLAARAYLFPAPFDPVVLSPGEQQALDAKLERLERGAPDPSPSKKSSRTPASDYTPDGRLQPLPYSEEGASREVRFTEREINAMLAANTSLGDKVAIDLADSLVSARMLIPLDPDFPVLGGKVVRVRGGLELLYREGKPVVRLRGVSLMGVPLPNAWLGGIKNRDLVQEFGAEEGFWKTFADGVDAVEVREGVLQVRLKE